MTSRFPLWLALLMSVLLPLPARAACCYFAAKDADVLQPAQKAFLSWDPVEKVESFTVQPRFEGNAAEAVYKVIRERLEKYQKERPGGYLVREAPAEDLKKLKLLAGHLKEGQFVTKIRKTFTKGEMGDDLLIVPARLGKAEDKSEYEEVLPTSPP